MNAYVLVYAHDCEGDEVQEVFAAKADAELARDVEIERADGFHEVAIRTVPFHEVGS